MELYWFYKRDVMTGIIVDDCAQIFCKKKV